MHDESLGFAITKYVFDDEDMYRRHYVPSFYHMRNNPKDHERVMELVDNACMKFSKTKGIPYEAIDTTTKKQVAMDIYKEMMSNETDRSKRSSK